MNILAFASAWTFGDLTACRREVSSGVFDGIEGPAPRSVAEARRYGRSLAQDRIPFIAEVCTGGAYAPASSVTFETHLAEFREQAERGAEASPLFLNCLVGSDSWPATKAIDFLGRALDVGRKLGVELSFETHRSRPTFHPWLTAELLRSLPDLRLTCDFSHWCVVCERLVDDEEALELAISRARHFHARVGYAQGPQVPDPRAPEYRAELEVHEGWWSRIARSALERAQAWLSFTPEFGPDGYLQHAPFSNTPVADLSDINRWMAARQRHRLSEQCQGFARAH
jgi:sugar phosphate isomerase/epimerase